MRVRVEVCVTSLAEAMAAEASGADSVEICTWLACGGVTPSYGLVNTLKERMGIPLRVLVRPTPGGFVYSEFERQTILRDAMLIGLSGVGLVTGALNDNGLPEASLMKAVRMAAPENELTFHRAIDHCDDPLAALDACVELGIHRVLTSGGRTLAIDAMDLLREMVRRADVKVRIAAAGGITSENVVELVERTGVSEVHFSAQRTVATSTTKAAMSSVYDGMTFETVPDEAKIDGVMNALLKAGLR